MTIFYVTASAAPPPRPSTDPRSAPPAAPAPRQADPRAAPRTVPDDEERFARYAAPVASEGGLPAPDTSAADEATARVNERARVQSHGAPPYTPPIDPARAELLRGADAIAQANIDAGAAIAATDMMGFGRGMLGQRR